MIVTTFKKAHKLAKKLALFNENMVKKRKWKKK